MRIAIRHLRKVKSAAATDAQESKVEWQVRMPEDRHSEDGWVSNNEVGATYLKREHGAEVRTRTVTDWVAK